ncbi:MAG TPA: hypothetical protein VJC14_00015 [Candidatus Paceibacterota bacterium]
MDQNNEPPKIVFEGEEFQHSARSFQTPVPKIIQWVIKYSGGYVKDEQQASYVLIGFVVVAMLLSFYLVFARGQGEVDMNALKNMQIIHPDIIVR